MITFFMAFYSYLFYGIFMEEQNRKKTRFQANFEGYYRLKNNIDWYDCFIYDISETGTLIRMKQTLIVDDELEICLNSEDKSDVIQGKVANVKGQVAGIQFSTKNVSEIIEKTIERAFKKSRIQKKGHGF